METNIAIRVSLVVNWVEVMMGHPFSHPNPNILEHLYGDLLVLDKDTVVLLIQAFHACLTVTLMTVCTPTRLHQSQIPAYQPIQTGWVQRHRGEEAQRRPKLFFKTG